MLVHELEAEEKERHKMTDVVQEEQRFETPGEFPKYWAPIRHVTQFTLPWWTVSQTAKRRQPHPGRICMESLLCVYVGWMPSQYAVKVIWNGNRE